MLDQRQTVAQFDENRAELFTERYEVLLVWTMRLANRKRELAEDLVQDAFVQFMLGRTRLKEIENIDGYELRIAVNGTLVSSVKGSSDLSELNLNLTPDDPVEFVEVSSDQGVQLLFFNTDPAVEQTLVVQRRDDDLREYRFGEASFEPSRTIDPKVFEIESTLTGGAGEAGRPGHWAIRDLTNSRVPPTPSTSAPPTASAEPGVDVAYLLNQAKADRNANRSVSVQEADETADTVAAYEDIRAHFLKQEPRGPTDERIRNYSTRVGNRAYRALFRAIELKNFVARFANVDMRTVTPDARSKWLAMVHGHADAFEREAGPLFQELQPVFFPSATVPASEDLLIQSDADLARAVERLYQLAFFCNEAVSSALTISAHSSATTIKSSQFRESLITAQKLAKRIGQYETLRVSFCS